MRLPRKLAPPRLPINGSKNKEQMDIYEETAPTPLKFLSNSSAATADSRMPFLSPVQPNNHIPIIIDVREPNQPSQDDSSLSCSFSTQIMSKDLQREPEKTKKSKLGSNPKAKKITKKKKRRNLRWIASGLCLIGFLIVSVLCWNLFMEDIFGFSSKLVTLINSLGHPVSDIIFIVVFIVVVGTGLPAGSLLILLIAFTLKSPWLALFYSLFSKMMVSSSYYWLVRTKLSERFKRDCNESTLFRVIFEESQKRPWMTSFCIQFLAVPPAIIIVFMALAEIPLFVFFVSVFICTALTNLLIGWMGASFSNAKDIISSSKFSEKSFTEKVFFILSVMMLVFSVVFVCCLVFWVRRRMKKMKEQLEKEKSKIEDKKNKKKEDDDEEEEEAKNKSCERSRNSRLSSFSFRRNRESLSMNGEEQKEAVRGEKKFIDKLFEIDEEAQEHQHPSPRAENNESVLKSSKRELRFQFD